MRLIKLTRGYTAKVSDRDYARCMKGPTWSASPRWREDGTVRTVYAFRTVIAKGKRTGQYMHRFILGLKLFNIKADHEDGNGLNNQRRNIRKATQRQNCHNRHTNIRNTSGFQGVSWWEPLRCWRVSIRNEHTSVHLGYFTSKVQAAKAYDKAARKMHGKYARTNF